jgi:hypothetical protein
MSNKPSAVIAGVFTDYGLGAKFMLDAKNDFHKEILNFWDSMDQPAALF